MLEKSPTTSNNTDVTRVKAADSSTTTPSISHLPTQTTNEEATRMMTSHSETGSFTDIQLTIGSVIKNTYELVAVLGEGGMGSVFKARNKDWDYVGARDPYVALKVLKPELSDNKELVMGLFREFDRIKMLSDCPNNIKVHDFGRDGANVFMTMEYLTGQTLSEYINHQPTTLAHAWFIIEGIGNALTFAHEHNIVHRDIKPGNIFITEKGVVKVLDFGIASKINENEDDKTKFNGDDLGAFTLAYASPDTRLGDPPDCRDDIYSFACVIYEILTGKKFFDPKRKSKKAEPIHGLNNRQMDALNKALAFERDQRTANIRELLDKLRPVKTPWVKYASIGGGVVIIISLLVVFRPDTNQTLVNNGQTKQEGVSEKEAQRIAAEKEAQRIAAEKEAQRIAAEKEAQRTVAEKEAQRTAAEKEAQRTAAETEAQRTAAETEAQRTAAETEAQRTAAETEAQRTAELNAKGYSADEIVQLQTSKPEYKNGEAFHLSFTLTQPSYVRVIDRDAKGKETTLRPNDLQPDKLLPANKQHVFPPNDIDVPVQGIAGNNTVTIVASTKPFSKAIKLLNADGSISEQVQSGSYSWVQVHYALR